MSFGNRCLRKSYGFGTAAASEGSARHLRRDLGRARSIVAWFSRSPFHSRYERCGDSFGSLGVEIATKVRLGRLPGAEGFLGREGSIAGVARTGKFHARILRPSLLQRGRSDCRTGLG